MWEIGAEEKVVGVSQYATYLEGASSRTTVSGDGGPNVEAVIGTNPDMVLVPNATNNLAPERVEQIRATPGITVYVFEKADSLEFIAEKTRTTGQLVGACTAADARADAFEESLDAIAAALGSTSRPTGLNVFFGFTSGQETYINKIMQTAGVRNGAAQQGITGFKQLNPEVIASIDPAWIIKPSGSTVPDTPAYRSTTAVQSGQVVTVNPNYLQQPAPRTIRAIETILQNVHPEAYQRYQDGEEYSPEDGSSSAGSASTSTASQQPNSSQFRSGNITVRSAETATVNITETGPDKYTVSVTNQTPPTSVSINWTHQHVESRAARSGAAVEHLRLSVGNETNTTATVQYISNTQYDGDPLIASAQRNETTASTAYFRINTSPTSQQLDTAQIDVRVNRSQLNLSTGEPVTLYRRGSQGWTALDTSTDSGNTSTVTVSAFSTFAVGPAGVNATPAAPSQQTTSMPATSTPMPTSTPSATQASDSATATPTPAGTATSASTPFTTTTGPGFEALAGVIAALTVGLWFRRRTAH
jgi:iron complex transport system substrate-binding protein